MDRVETRAGNGFIDVFVDGLLWAIVRKGPSQERAIQDAGRRASPCESILQARNPTPGETYREYLTSYMVFGKGFEFSEIVSAHPSRQLPPMFLWRNIVATMVMANILRRACVREGVRGLIVTDVYRPASERARSRHKTNHAIDLVPLAGQVSTQRAREVIAAASAKLWRAHGRQLKMGLGHYGEPGEGSTALVHLDVGTRHRAWQYWRGRSISPPSPCTLGAPT